MFTTTAPRKAVHTFMIAGSPFFNVQHYIIAVHKGISSDMRACFRHALLWCLVSSSHPPVHHLRPPRHHLARPLPPPRQGYQTYIQHPSHRYQRALSRPLNCLPMTPRLPKYAESDFPRNDATAHRWLKACPPDHHSEG